MFVLQIPWAHQNTCPSQSMRMVCCGDFRIA